MLASLKSYYLKMKLLHCLAFALLLIRETLTQSPDVQAQISIIQTRLEALNNETNRLGREVQLKNDQTQFLQSDVHNLNQSLVSEQQKSANLETRVAALETQLKNAVSSLGETQTELRQTTALSKTLQNELLATKRELAILKFDKEKLNETISNITRTFNSTVSALIASNKDPSVAFTFRNLKLSDTLNNNMTLKFFGLVSNIGSGYDSNSGQFTAPVTGIYSFSTTLSLSTDDHLSCYIVKNGHDYLVEVFASMFSAYSSASTTVLVHLDTGDTIDVSHCSGNGTLSSYKSSFSGFLIRSG